MITFSVRLVELPTGYMYSDYLAKLFFVMAQWVHLKLRSGSTSATLASVYSPVTCIYVLSLVKDIIAWKCKDNFFFLPVAKIFLLSFCWCVSVFIPIIGDGNRC